MDRDRSQQESRMVRPSAPPVSRTPSRLDDDFDVYEQEGEVIGDVVRPSAPPVSQTLWRLGFDVCEEDREVGEVVQPSAPPVSRTSSMLNIDDDVATWHSPTLSLPPPHSVHVVREKILPPLSQQDIDAFVASIVSMVHHKDKEPTRIKSILQRLEDVYCEQEQGRDRNSRLSDYPRVYMTPDVAQALQTIASSGGANGSEGRFVAQGYDDVKITIARDGGLLVPGSPMQKRALRYNDLVGTVTMDMPVLGADGLRRHGGVRIGSPTYWKVYQRLRGGDKVNWHNRLFDLGLADAARDAGLQRDCPVNTADLSKESKVILKQGYMVANKSEELRLGNLAAIAKLLNDVHYLENSESSALPTSQWGTIAGKRHTKVMAKEIIEGVEKFRKGEGRDAYEETGYLRYVPTSATKALKYSDVAKGYSGKVKRYSDIAKQILLAYG